MKCVAIVGAGINGLLSAFLLSERYPHVDIAIFDAEAHPLTANYGQLRPTTAAEV